MFTIEAIKAAHVKVKSGADFPKYVDDLKALGVKNYDTYVSDGHTEYTSTNNAYIKTDAKYPAMQVADKSNTEHFIQRLKIHQQGLTDYLTFCNDSADTGVEKWVVDIEKMTCTYFDKAGNVMLVEEIPQV
jgi:uncharacterized protein YbcV (DUF1398 family)